MPGAPCGMTPPLEVRPGPVPNIPLESPVRGISTGPRFPRKLLPEYIGGSRSVAGAAPPGGLGRWDGDLGSLLAPVPGPPVSARSRTPGHSDPPPIPRFRASDLARARIGEAAAGPATTPFIYPEAWPPGNVARRPLVCRPWAVRSSGRDVIHAVGFKAHGSCLYMLALMRPRASPAQGSHIRRGSFIGFIIHNRTC